MSNSKCTLEHVPRFGADGVRYGGAGPFACFDEDRKDTELAVASCSLVGKDLVRSGASVDCQMLAGKRDDRLVGKSRKDRKAEPTAKAAAIGSIIVLISFSMTLEVVGTVP